MEASDAEGERHGLEVGWLMVRSGIWILFRDFLGRTCNILTRLG